LNSDDEFWNIFEDKYEVIKLDFSEVPESGSFEEFQKKFGRMLLSAAHTGTHSIELERNFSSEMFASLIISNQVPYGVKLSDTKKKKEPWNFGQFKLFGKRDPLN